MPGFYMLTALTKFFPIFCGAHAPLTPISYAYVNCTSASPALPKLAVDETTENKGSLFTSAGTSDRSHTHTGLQQTRLNQKATTTSS